MLELLKNFLAAKRRWHSLRDADTLKAYQDTKAKKMVQYVASRSSFYRNHWQGYDLNDWQHLPAINKQLMMTQFDTFNTMGIKREEAFNFARQAEISSETLNNTFTFGLSSGTSGQRGLFVISEAERSMWAGVMLARVLHTFKAERVALFLRASSKLYDTVRRGRWLQFQYFNLTTPLEETLPQLDGFQPTMIVAPPSFLEQLAQARESGHFPIRPERLISVAEVLEPQDKIKLETIFKAPVHQIYQATEGLLAISCKHGSLHLQEDLVAVQFRALGEHHFTPIITDLRRKTQPIIRYDLGDVWRLETERCRCGNSWRTLKQIEGRKSDLIELLTSQGKQYLFPNELRQSILSVAGILDYTIVQKGENYLHVYLETLEAFSIVAANVEKQLKELLKRFDATVKLEFSQGLPKREATAKRRRIMRQ
jgi:putative adenylate-forming enzyme